MPAAFRNDLQIVYESPPYPRALEMGRGTMDPKVAARLREVLIEASNDPDAREALLRFFKTTRFMPVDEGSQHTLKYISDGVQRIRTEVE